MMKTIKASMIALAFVLGIGGAFATKAPSPSHKPTPVWWSFSGTQAQINDLTKYTAVSTEPTCAGGSSRCAVQANRSTGNPNQPDLSVIYHEDKRP